MLETMKIISFLDKIPNSDNENIKMLIFVNVKYKSVNQLYIQYSVTQKYNQSDKESCIHHKLTSERKNKDS